MTGLAFRGALIAAFACLAFACLTWIGATPARADNRVALVIGNGAYVHVPHLPNPSNDADDVAAALKRTGFQTIVGKDLDQSGMQDVVIKFARAARTADVAVFYYSGHAMQYGGVNYLFPIDAQLSDEADLVRMARVDDILANLKQAKNLRILVLDACRNNPFADQLKESIGPTRSVSIERGLARIQSQDGTIISYSTQAGRTAKDGDGRNSPYTSAFLRHIEDKEDIATVFHHISASVYESTRGSQVPELSLSYFGEFYLNGKVQTAIAPAAAPAPLDPCSAAGDHWKSAEAINTRGAFEDHLARFSNCAFAGLARARIEALKGKLAVVAPAVPAATLPASSGTERPGILGYSFGKPAEKGSTSDTQPKPPPAVQQALVAPPIAPPVSTEPSDEESKMISGILGGINDRWDEIFKASGQSYVAPKLVLFHNVTNACGMAQATGPFYCPTDRQIFIDTGFLREGLSRDCSAYVCVLAVAYIMAHEAGHHVQNLLGILPRVMTLQQAAVGKPEATVLQVKVELQADCLSGISFNRMDKNNPGFHKLGDIDAALTMVSAPGDTLLRQADGQGQVMPDSFTHASAEQRRRWFMTGYQQGTVQACNTFGAAAL